MRLDAYLVEKKICTSRIKAKEVITCGLVSLNGKITTKPSILITEGDQVVVEKTSAIPYVSRGGLKLEHAIKTFNVDFTDKIVLDIGATTGGFTDCALKNGAKQVWAIDVGTNQLDISLKSNPKVKSLEHTDIRKLDPDVIDTKVDVVVADLSFISLQHIIKYLPKFLTSNGYAILLIKPQFEAGPQNICKGGIVKDKKVHIRIINDIINFSAANQLFLNKLTHAPILDIRKNIEYLGLFSQVRTTNIDYKEVVNMAFEKQRLIKLEK